MQIFSLALLSVIATARQSTNLLDLGSFPNVMDRMNDRFKQRMNDHFKDFGLNKDNNNDFGFGNDIDDLDIGSGLESDEEWNPFKETRVDFDNFDSRVMRTSSSTRKFSDGTTIITLVKNMGDKETTNVITIMPDGAWKQETRTKIIKKEKVQ